MKKLLITLNFLLIITSCFAQKYFEGIITYDILYPEKSISEESQAYIPKQQSTYFKDGMMRMQSKTNALDMIIISKQETEEASFLINFMGMKMAVNTTKAEIKGIVNDKNSSYQIIETTKSKLIAGYKCHEVLLSTDDGNMSIYVCNDLYVEGANWFLNNKIKGAIMEMTYRDEEGKFTLSASSVKKTPLENTLFNIPSDYIEIGQEEINGLLGGSSPF